MPELASYALSATLWVIFCYLILSRCSARVCTRSLLARFHARRRFSNFQGKTFSVRRHRWSWHLLPHQAIHQLRKAISDGVGNGITIHLQPSTLNLNEDSSGLVRELHKWPVDDFSWANPGLSFHSWHSSKFAPFPLPSSYFIVICRHCHSSLEQFSRNRLISSLSMISRREAASQQLIDAVQLVSIDSAHVLFL